MKDMLALQDDAGTLPETLCVANGTVVIRLGAHCRILIKRDASLIQARQTDPFSYEAIARMTTS
jgi:hypothetical protein